jgi:drug/metabolite transporter (DMT)-like permease
MAIVRGLQQKYGAVPVIWRTQAVTIRLTAIANVVMAKAAGHFAASRASSTTFLIPVVALALGVLLRNETVAPLSLAGGLICLLGAYQMKRSQ